MLRQLVVRSAIVAVVVVFASCSDNKSRLFTAPTRVVFVPPASPGASQDATPIAMGQITAHVVTAADPPCGIQLAGEPPEPCRRFVVTTTTSGMLKVRLTSPGPDALTLRVSSQMYWGTTIEALARVESGLTYEIDVALHGLKGSQPFELTATLEPF